MEESNNEFIEVNIIHLNEKLFYHYSAEYNELVKRHQSFEKEMAEQCIVNFRVWDAIYNSSCPREAISQSHKQIVRDAKSRGLPSVIVMEDDVKFNAAGAYKYFIDKMPDEFDLFLGGVSGGMIDENNIVHNFSGLFMYCLNARFYDVFLSADETKNIDRWLGNTYYKSAEVKPVYKVCNPLAAITSNGISSHHGIEMNMENYFKPYELYKG